VKERLWLRIVAGMAVGLLYFTLVVAGTTVLTGRILAALGRHPPDWLSQALSTFLGLTIGMLIIAIISQSAARSHRGTPPVFRPIVEALERIAAGDFTVRLSETLPGHERVGDLIVSVNALASELERVEQMRREFVSNVSHEIQSPLTSIRGFAQALRDDALGPAERQHYLTIIETESTRLSRLSDNLLRLAALDAELATIARTPYRLDRQVRELILACEPQWSAKGLELDVALEAVTIRANEDLLGQVWLNLLHNSIKFTPAGGSIGVHLTRDGATAELQIADSGCGIPEDAQARIFERFYTADSSRRRSAEGSGLGLAIASKIVELHRGTIAVASVPGHGATFTVSLPLE